MSEDAPKRTATTRDLMKKYGVTRPAISGWIEAGLPHDRLGEGTRGELRFDLEETAGWVRSTGRAMKRGRRSNLQRKLDQNPAASGDVARIELEHAEAKLRKDLAAAEKAEMELDTLRGKLLDAEEVKQGHLDRIARARAVFLGGPASLGPDLVGKDLPEIEAVLRDWVYQGLTELATEGDD